MAELTTDTAVAGNDQQADTKNQGWSEFISWRRDLRLSQGAIAQKVGVTQAAVSGWERGLYPPDLTLVPSIAEALSRTRNEVLLSMADVFLPKINTKSIQK